MPAGTHPGGVLAASRVFAREQFGLQYRYALVLHTDQAHPHVHLVVKALGEDGKRLNIRKATLRGWRQEFARQLRLQRIPANATDRFVRGQTPKALRDGIYRASQRGESRHLRASTADAAARERLQGMRERLFQGWGSAADVVRDRGQWLLADRMVRFAQELPPVRTDQEFWTKRDRSKPIVHRERVEALTR